MADPSDPSDLSGLCEMATPAETMAGVAARLDRLGAEAEPALLEALVTALEARFTEGGHAEKDWFEHLLDCPLVNRPANADDTSPADSPGLGKRLCALLRAAMEDMDPEERVTRVGAAARRLPDISLLCAAVMAIEQDHDGASLGEAWSNVRKALLERIGVLAASSGFWAQRDPAALLWFWFVHGEEQRVYLFTRRAMDDPIGLSALLTIPLEREGSGPEQHDVVAVRRWSKIIDFQALEARAVPLAMSAPSRTDRRRARRYLEAFATGKSELFR